MLSWLAVSSAYTRSLNWLWPTAVSGFTNMCHRIQSMALLPCSSAVGFVICSWNLDSPLCRLQCPQGFPHEVPKTAVADQMAPIYPKRWDLHDHRSPVHLRDHQPSSQCPLLAMWPGCQAMSWLTRHSTAKAIYLYLLLHLYADHQAVSGIAVPAVLVTDGLTTWQLIDNNLPPADLWRRAVSRGHCGATLWPSPSKQ